MAAPQPVPSGDRPRPVFSRLYARISEGMDAEGLAALRTELLAPLSGTVVEVGCGNGRNFARYPPAVSRVTAVEPEPHLRALATRAAAAAPVPVTVVPGTAEALPVPDAAADAAVLCLVLCSLPDRATALAEIARVLRPGGTLALLEHGLGPTRRVRAVQRLADATLWPLLAGGCHTAVDPVGLVERAGFEVTALRRLRFPDSRLTLPATSHVLGLARRPA
ncbi:Methyltransferase domain-containing protein [Geodermatophilus obscurus]|uniref:Methyltransferase domain-containing protein n=1 Tax=Geodermatophilus obscurus TaxID=1861 RepID=A0A1M7RU59_9ACTN|nr:methyltransferase domain-containing protein [Geodermatophilus obscurus]SHN49809.1 Methyltransferase domain-containing protein [Geodermatophilus obscurus]